MLVLGTSLLAVAGFTCQTQEDSDMNQSEKPEQHTSNATAQTASATQPAEQFGRGLATATFGAGCFWGVESAFRQVEGVKATEVGYSGGNIENPTYRQVCSDRTGHAEVVRVHYDPDVVSYDQLLDVFWRCHDPTQRNRQGPDVGRQYRSVIFYHDETQEDAAKESKIELQKSKRYQRPIATLIQEAAPFYRAEEYHQQYLEKRGQKVCHNPTQ
jgi:peptide-methionine (S)-S-oxide reductase